MKKILAMVLALCLLCGATALAENTTINQDSTSKHASTTVSYEIKANETYTVTIPSSVTLTGTDNLNGTVSVRLQTPDFNVSDKTITVKLTAAAFKLVSGTNEIPYTIKMSGNEYKVGDTVLSWTYGDDTDKTQPLGINAVVSSNLPAGDYTDTLTFTVSVADTAANPEE